MLVNERVSTGGDTAPVSVDDVRAALDLSTHRTVGVISGGAERTVYAKARLV